MIELTPDAQTCLDGYLEEIQISLAGCPSVDIADVERDVMTHIEKSLAEAETPVEQTALGEVLEQLGSPSQWIPEEDRSWEQRQAQVWRRLLSPRKRLPGKFGGADIRFGYPLLSIMLVPVGVSLWDVPPAAGGVLFASFLCARLAVAPVVDVKELGRERLLVYPILLWGYFLLVGILLFWIGVAALAWVILLEPVGGKTVPVAGHQIAVTEFAMLTFLVLTPPWWIVLGVITWRRPRWVHNLFHPFAGRFRGLYGLLLSVVGLLLFVAEVMFAGYIYCRLASQEPRAAIPRPPFQVPAPGDETGTALRIGDPFP